MMLTRISGVLTTIPLPFPVNEAEGISDDTPKSETSFKSPQEVSDDTVSKETTASLDP
jgi:hypothetical protein